MSIWNIPLNHLDALPLAADVRLGNVDYCNDQIWELKICDGVPRVLGLCTTYGKRARRFIMFPQFREGKTTVSDPASFLSQPIILNAFPNYTSISFSPLPNLDVEIAYWIPESQVVCGRIVMYNRAEIARNIRLEWAAMLTPAEEGHRMAAAHIQMNHVLAGKTAGLYPVISMKGSVETENVPYPALSHAIELLPTASRDWSWCHAALASQESSFTLARNYLNRNWEAEFARIQMINASQITIQTGDPAWNLAFNLTQHIALGLFVSSGSKTPPETNHPDPFLVSFPITVRQPDQGFSMKGNGSDYPSIWSGISILDAYYLTGLLLSVAPELLKEMIRNFTAVQDRKTGFIDGRPGAGGQRSRTLAPPLLAYLTWRIYQVSGDKNFITGVFEPLLRFIQIWFSIDHDRDQDGVPEWDHLNQFGFEGHPIFSRMQADSLGANISTAESPALIAFLFNELQALSAMARILEIPEPTLQIRNAQLTLENICQVLNQTLESTWDESVSLFRYRDRDTHQSPIGERIAGRLGNGEIAIQQTFSSPIRLVLRLQSSKEATQRPSVTIKGTDTAGISHNDQIPIYDWQWALRQIGRTTSTNVYQTIERIEVENIQVEDQISVNTVNFQCEDVSLFLPLWANMALPSNAEKLVLNALVRTEKYWLSFGLPLYPQCRDEGTLHQTSFLWNTLVGEGLLNYGYRTEAAELVSNMMSAVTQSLEMNKGLRSTYRSDNGLGNGERNALPGLAPMDLFLKTLGVALYSPGRIGLDGFNPFPWDVRVEYRGVTILCMKDQTIITFPDGQIIQVNDPAPCVVTIEKGSENTG